MNHMIPHNKPTITAKDVANVLKVLRSGFISQGKKVRQFEKQFAKYHGTRDAVAVNSGTSALHLALIALNVKKGDEVLLPTYVCTALLNVINYVNAKPVLVDVDPDDFNISVDDMKRKLKRKTKAIIVPHMFGQAADIKSIMRLGVPVIEDCAQSVGAKYSGKKVGTFGAIGIFSFYATKVLTTGEGGMIIAKSSQHLTRMRDIREYDHKPDYKLRYNYKMTDMQAALGISQLRQLPSMIRHRKKIAKIYDKNLSKLNLQRPVRKNTFEHIYFRYIIKIGKNRDSAMKKMKRAGITCAKPVFRPIHRYLGRKGFFHTENLSKETLSLPIYPALKTADAERVCRNLKKIIE